MLYNIIPNKPLVTYIYVQVNGDTLNSQEEAAAAEEIEAVERDVVIEDISVRQYANS